MDKRTPTRRARVRAHTIKARLEISAVLIVKDEAEHIDDLAASLAGVVDEVVLLDTGSSDDTVERAQAQGFRVFHRPWTEHFSDARNAALAHARGAWAMWIDADERWRYDDPDELRRLIRSAGQQKGARIDAFWVTLDSFTSDDLDPSTTQRVQQARLFRRSCFHFEGRIHEQLTPNNPANPPVFGRAPNSLRIEHLGYTPQIWQRKNKAARNRDLVESTVTDPAHADFERARVLLLSSPAAGLELLLRALPQMPADRDTHRLGTVLAARTLVKFGRHDEALELLARVNKTAAFSTELDVVRATALARAGRDDEAFAALTEIGETTNDNSSNLDLLVRLPALRAETLAISGRPAQSWQALVPLLRYSHAIVGPAAEGIAIRAWALAVREGRPDRYLDELSEAADDDAFRTMLTLLSEVHQRAALGARHLLSREPLTVPDPRLMRYLPKLAVHSPSAVLSLANSRLDAEPALALGVAEHLMSRAGLATHERDAAELVRLRALLLLGHVTDAVRGSRSLLGREFGQQPDAEFVAVLAAMAAELAGRVEQRSAISA